MAPQNAEGDAFEPTVGDLISLKKAAKLSGLSYSHMRYLARNKKLWAKKLGRDWVTTEKAVREYLARDRRPGPKPKKGSEPERPED